MDKWIFKADLVKVVSTSERIECRSGSTYLQVCVAVTGLSMPQVVSQVRSALWGEGLRSLMPAELSIHDIDQELRRCVRLSRGNWDCLREASKAVFSLEWSPNVVFQKVQQNRLYSVKLGSKSLGRLRRPKQAEGWLYLPEGGGLPDQTWVGHNLAEAKTEVVNLITRS